jgi:hypothetical protein
MDQQRLVSKVALSVSPFFGVEFKGTVCTTAKVTVNDDAQLGEQAASRPRTPPLEVKGWITLVWPLTHEGPL